MTQCVHAFAISQVVLHAGTAASSKTSMQDMHAMGTHGRLADTAASNNVSLQVMLASSSLGRSLRWLADQLIKEGLCGNGISPAAWV